MPAVIAVSQSLSHPCVQLQRIEIAADAHWMKVKALKFNCNRSPPAMLRTFARFCGGQGSPTKGQGTAALQCRKAEGTDLRRRMNP
jgi:hypothetical protein